MALATWWREENLPLLNVPAGFHADASEDVRLISAVARLDTHEVNARLRAGHRVYLAWLGHAPAGYGWVATQSAFIGELNVGFDLPSGDRYLWDFATLPRWRGRGVYPQLLQRVVEEELFVSGERFWIIHAPENLASASGIRKAGFKSVAELSFLTVAEAAVSPYADLERASAGGARLLGLPFIHEPVLSPWWHPILDARDKGSTVPHW
jgi:hypothetical protein